MKTGNLGKSTRRLLIVLFIVVVLLTMVVGAVFDLMLLQRIGCIGVVVTTLYLVLA